MTILGIDPGLRGACAILYAEQVFAVYDMPTHTITVNKRQRRVLDPAQLWDWLERCAPWFDYAIIEDPHAMPGQGVSSSFSFGFSCGVVQALVAASRTPVHLVRPSIWKRALGLSDDKDASRRRASQLFPSYAHLWARKQDDGRAEAVLLAWYGRQIA